MQHSTSQIRATVVSLVALASFAVFADAADAQERTHDRILFLVPVPEQPEDSQWARDMTRELRIRAQNKFRHKWQVITEEVVADLLVNSGFAPTTIVGADMVEQLARPLQAHAYVYGWLRRNAATPVATYRMVDVSRTGLSGWMTVMGQPGDPPRSFADRIADSLDNQVRAADLAKECNMRRDRSEFRRARDAADRAFQFYANHPSTAVCLAYVFQGLQQSSDSLIWAYEKNTRGDSSDMRAWERLSREYQRAGDTASAVAAFAKQLDANPDDGDMRYNLAAGYVVTRSYEQARQVLDEGLRRDPTSLRFVTLKARACQEGELWGCALEALTRQYELDSTLVGDTTHYPRMFALAGQVGDTAAMLRWATLGLQYQPRSIGFLRARATLLRQGGHLDSALVVYERLVELDSTDLSSVLTVVQALNEQFTIDSLTPVDTAALARIGGLLVHILTLSRDPNVITTVGGEYLKIAQKYGQAQNDWNAVIRYTELALANDPRGLLNAAANFWLGFGVFSITVPHMDQQIMASRSCPAIDAYERNLRRATQALTAGRSVAPETVDQFLGYLQQFAERPGLLRQSFCRNN